MFPPIQSLIIIPIFPVFVSNILHNILVDVTQANLSIYSFFTLQTTYYTFQNINNLYSIVTFIHSAFCYVYFITYSLRMKIGGHHLCDSRLLKVNTGKLPLRVGRLPHLFPIDTVT